MCLAVPGKVMSITEREGMRTARVEFGGILREVSLEFVPDAAIGEYVMVHVGFAISRVHGEEAERTYELLQSLGALRQELEEEDSPDPLPDAN
jgi:hydrogenase expression/formation protein HypC